MILFLCSSFHSAFTHGELSQVHRRAFSSDLSLWSIRSEFLKSQALTCPCATAQSSRSDPTPVSNPRSLSQPRHASSCQPGFKFSWKWVKSSLLVESLTMGKLFQRKTWYYSWHLIWPEAWGSPLRRSHASCSALLLLNHPSIPSPSLGTAGSWAHTSLLSFSLLHDYSG